MREHSDEWMVGDPRQLAPTLFGDGGHPSTALAAGLLAAELCRRERGARTLDAGCGTGTLTVLAASLGASVVAVDHDYRAIESVRSRSAADVYQLDIGDFLVGLIGSRASFPSFDVVVANLPEPTLIEHATVLTGALRPGGVVMATGFLLCRASVVARAWKSQRVIRRGYQGYAALLVSDRRRVD